MLRIVRPAAATAVVAVAALLFVACASDRSPDIPASAQLKEEGNSRLTFATPADGMVYVYDVPSDRILYSGRVEEGETLIVNPQDDKITLDGQPVSQQHLRVGQQYRIFFQPASGGVEVQTHTQTSIHHATP
jgi:hypothetical protein